MMVLPDPEEGLKETDTLNEVRHKVGLQAVMGDFVSKMMSKSDSAYLMGQAAHASDAERQQRGKDMDYWIEHELRHYPRTAWNYDKLRAQAEAGRLVFCVGSDTVGLPPYRMAELFSQRVGAPVQTLAGGHIGYGSQPEAFARDFIAAQ